MQQNPLVARRREIDAFIRKIATIQDDEQLNSECHAFLYSFPPQYGLELAAILAWANPFFTPDVPPENAEKLAVSADEMAGFALRARLTATRSDQLNILVACAPKSASTFLHAKLCEALSLPGGMLFAFGANPSALGANLREQEIDELALMRTVFKAEGFVAQHHMRMNPYTARLLKLYNIKPIVTYRNIFDTLVSLDDMLMDWRKDNPDYPGNFYNDGMPDNYFHMPREDRLTLLAHRWGLWLLQFYVSWKKCEAHGLVQPLWVSYEENFLGDKAKLAARIADFLGKDRVKVKRLKDALADKSGGKAVRLNKGVAGRGADVPDSVREIVVSAARLYAGDMDLSPLVGEI